MKISLNAYRINKIKVTVFISLSGIENDDFKLVGNSYDANYKEMMVF